MSNLERVENLKQIVRLVQPDFDKLAKIHNAVNYEREASFALQILNDNSYLQGVAMGDQDSLKRAIINVAAVGLSLSPVHKLAYLVPRDKKVCLDISYQGYIQLATDAGALKWAVAEIVREKDKFTHHGIGKEPVHSFNPFKDRGKIVGCYCLAKTHGDEFIVSIMSADEVYSIRDRSMSWRAYQKDKSKTSPWNTDETEMIKKTVIKRAYKSWPKTDSRGDRLQNAIEITNQADPIDTGPTIEAADEGAYKSGIDTIREALKELRRPESAFLEHLMRTNNRDLTKLEDLTPLEVSQATIFLNHLLTKAKPKTEALSEKAG